MRKMFVFRCHALSHNLSFQIHTNTKKPCAHGDVAYKEGQLKHAYESGISYWYQTENCFKFKFIHRYGHSGMNTILALWGLGLEWSCNKTAT